MAGPSLFDDELHRTGGYGGDRLHDRRHRRIGVTHRRGIVETDDRQVARHAQAPLLGNEQGAERHLVVAYHHRRHPVVQREEILGGGSSRRMAEVADRQQIVLPVDYVEGAYVGYGWCDRKRMTPLFPFGHGLGYTSFAYRNAVVTGGRALSVTFDMVNTGARAGADVPQMYVARDAGGAPMRLAAFARVTLKPGETRRVTLTAEPRVVADYDVKLPGWRIDAGRYHVALGHDAADRSMLSSAMLEASTMRP